MNKINWNFYLSDEGTFDENPRTWMKVDDDARLYIERTRFFDLNDITNVIGTVSSGHELTVRHTLTEDGRTHRSMVKNDKETTDDQQCGRRPLCVIEAFRLHSSNVLNFLLLFNRLNDSPARMHFSNTEITRHHTIWQRNLPRKSRFCLLKVIWRASVG